MSGLLYYIPKRQQVKPDEIAALGLSHAITNGFVPRRCQGGPDHGSGVVVAQGIDAADLGYYADQQQWEKADGQDWWVGYYADRQPTPENLARENQISGHLVTLLDGNKWVIPLVRQWAADDDEPGWFSPLPRAMKREGGKWTSNEVLPRYAHLLDYAAKYFDLVMTAAVEGETEVDDDWLMDAAATLLAVNYRVSFAEIGALQLCGIDQFIAILDAAIDRKEIHRWAQKKIESATDGASTSDGQEESPQTTDPPLPTSGR